MGKLHRCVGEFRLPLGPQSVAEPVLEPVRHLVRLPSLVKLYGFIYVIDNELTWVTPRQMVGEIVVERQSRLIVDHLVERFE